MVSVEGTGSYGAGLARYLTAAGVRVVEVNRPDRQDRRRQGKSDPLDAVSAARAALSGKALHGVGPDTAALLLVAAGDNPGRLRSESSWAAPRRSRHPPARSSSGTALHALEDGQLPCASSEQAILRIAASLGDPAIAVRLRAVPGNLDKRTITLVAAANS